MPESVRQKAEATLAEVTEVSQHILPMPQDANAIVPLKDADKPASAEIKRRMAEIDITDTQSIVSFGSGA